MKASLLTLIATSKQIQDSKYYISEDGKIINSKNGKTVPQFLNKSGYYMVCITLNGVRNHYVHRLTAQAFVPNPENLPIVNHIDNTPGNNHYLNLEFTTQAGNISHSASQNRMTYGESHFNAKLNEAKVRLIRKLFSQNVTVAALAVLTGVHTSTIARVLTTGWRQVL